MCTFTFDTPIVSMKNQSSAGLQGGPWPSPNNTYKICDELSDSNICMSTMYTSPCYPTVDYASHLKKLKI